MRVIVCCGLAMCAFAVLPLGAGAFPWFSDPYTHDGGGGSCAGALKDPVNLVWKGNRGAAAAARNTVVHSGWSNTSGGAQSLYVSGAPGLKVCRGMKYQRASGTFSRFHVRIWRVPNSGGTSILAPGSVHHEDFISCCPPPPICTHAVDANGPTGSGFDWGRRTIVADFQNGGHTATGKAWGNTQNFHQCDGDWAGSDGIGVVLGNNHRH